MKSSPVSALLILSSLVPAVSYAQSPPTLRSTWEKPVPKLQSVQQVLNAPGQATVQERLESLYDKEIEVTVENLQTLGRLTDAPYATAERVVAIRIFGGLYDRANSQAANAEIRAKLRAMAQSSDRAIAAAALLQYTRTEYAPDTEVLLDRNHARGFIDDNDLYGELAHNILHAPESDQLRIADRLGKSKNKYGLDILAWTLKVEKLRARLGKPMRTKLIRILEANEPELSVTIGEFGFTEAISYSDWLHSLASLKSETAGVKYEDVVLEHINKGTTPKRALAFLISEEGKSTARRIEAAKLAGVFDRIAKYANEQPYPQNQDIKEISESVLRLKKSIQP